MPLPSKVHVFTLTDRASLLCVVINNAERYASVAQKPDTSFAPAERRVFFDAV